MNRFLIYINGIASMSFMMGQIALTMAVSFMFSNSVYIFSLLTGIYLFAMGLGTLLVDYLEKKDLMTEKSLFYNIFCGMLLFNPGIYILLILNESSLYLYSNHGIWLEPLMLILAISLSLMMGIISGFELPFFTTLYKQIKAKGLISILTSDYLGACVGNLAFALIIFPLFGLVKGIFYVHCLVMISLTFFWIKQSQIKLNWAEYFVWITLVIFSILSAFYAKYLLNYLDYLFV